MDILSHGLWAALGAKAANIKQGKRVVRPLLAFFFGVFPDVFAFAIPFIAMLWSMLTGDASFAPPSEGRPPSLGSPEMLLLAERLYNVSHSLIVFALVFGVIWFIRKKPLWELGGWSFHILCDIPTHAREFFPTPVFWPIASWTVDGYPWGKPWFIATNYALLTLVSLGVWYWKRRKTSSKTQA
jgi:hypothetical protein